MVFFDVHCHLDICKEIKEIISKTQLKNIILITNGINHKSNNECLHLSKNYPNVRCALGLYPLDALKLTDVEIEKELKFIYKNKDKILAIGEVGLDFKETEERERQIKIFNQIIDLAIKIDKPLIIHSRKAEKECIDLLEEKNAKKVIMHCFSGKFSLIERIVKNEWYISIPSNVTFSTHFQNIIKKINIKNLLCETDAPFLHPAKLNNNSPENVILSYKKISEIKEISIKKTEDLIEKNLQNLGFL